MVNPGNAWLYRQAALELASRTLREFDTSYV
jgi:hypothetical protein